MSNEWGSVPLIELTATPPTYGVVQPGQNLQDGVPMVRVNNFQAHSLNLTEVMRIAPEVESKYMRTRIREGDVLITIVGSVGQVAIVPSDLNDWNIARAVAMVRPKVPELSRWIALVLRSPDAQYQLGIAANTTVQTTINLKDLRQLRIPFPDELERHAIAHILGTLDDKIELNRKQNETLEAMARALFKAWFVDFEPVRAKMEGRWQRGQSLPGLPAHLYDLFPDRLVESELGEIPEGWEMRSLDSIANYLNGLALQKFPPESDDEFLPVIKIAQLRAGNTNGADRASAGIKPEYVVVDGDILFSWSGSLEVEVWNGGRGALNQHLFKVTTMGHIQRKHLTDARIAVAPPEGLKAFDGVLAPLFDQMVGNAQESRTLAQLRDTLLPKLISGELRVPDAERILEEAKKA